MSLFEIIGISVAIGAITDALEKVGNPAIGVLKNVLGLLEGIGQGIGNFLGGIFGGIGQHLSGLPVPDWLLGFLGGIWGNLPVPPIPGPEALALLLALI
ncbi:MAG: hypothetical protein ACUVXA_08440 [Candidatus Jordarchaeum sp.]|uniref:hypothetical protein n=1 Tax=Candidatus Jordarchaeum sp. TaxID=2823881 RepID=UPI0040497AF0